MSTLQNSSLFKSECGETVNSLLTHVGNFIWWQAKELLREQEEREGKRPRIESIFRNS